MEFNSENSERLSEISGDDARLKTPVCEFDYFAAFLPPLIDPSLSTDQPGANERG